jgi:hypothetical protein
MESLPPTRQLDGTRTLEYSIEFMADAQFGALVTVCDDSATLAAGVI